MGSFYKDYAFREFLLCPNPFFECQRFVNLAVHQGEEQLLISSYSSRSFLFLYLCYLLEWWRERRELWVEDGRRGGGNQLVLINRENSFPYFVIIIFIYLDCFCISMAPLYFFEKYDVILAIVVVLSNSSWCPISILCSDSADYVTYFNLTSLMFFYP